MNKRLVRSLVVIGLGLWMNKDWYEYCKDVNDTWADTCKKLEEENTKLKKELEQCKK